MKSQFLTVLLVLQLALTGCQRSETKAMPEPRQAGTNPAPVAPALTNSPATNAPAAPAAPAAAAMHQVLIEDDFGENQSENTYQSAPIVGVKPMPTNLPGVIWQLATGDGSYEASLTPPSETGTLARFHHVASVAVSLANNGAYTKPKIMTLRADMSFSGEAPPEASCVLGFYSALSGEHSAVLLTHFTGLSLQGDGSLQLIENGTPAGTAIKYEGKFDPTSPTTLIYSVDTDKGTISNISLSGSTANYSMTSGAFTNAATAFLGIGGQSDGSVLSYFTKIELSSGVVSAPPPPATDAK